MDREKISDAASLPTPIPWLRDHREGPVQRSDAEAPAEGEQSKTPEEPGAGQCHTSSSAGDATAQAPEEAAAGAPPEPTPVPAVPHRAPRRSIRGLVWARRGSQLVFLAAFVFLLLGTAFRGSFVAGADQPVRLPYPVEAFLLFDPFLAAVTLLSTGSVYSGMAWSLVVLALTVVFGRVFCGWICPFGTLHHFCSWVFPSRYLKGKRRVDSNRTRGWQTGKYYLMWGFFGAALLGSAVGGLLDPLCFAIRTLGLGLLPALQYFGLGAATTVAASNQRTLQGVTDQAQDLLAQTVWTSQQSYFNDAWLLVFFLLAALFMNRVIPRFWCRAVCPLGAFLGSASRFALVGMEKDHSKCTSCNLCLMHCQGADSPQGGVNHRQDECHVCLNCEVACPEDVIHFRFLPQRPKRATKPRQPDLDRRTVVTATLAGAAAIPALRIGSWPDRNYNAKVIRPPGSVAEKQFLERCVRCAECMKVCPNNALHPATFEAGPEGLWTPILIPRFGYCEFSCVLCGQVCPTGAIQRIDERQKTGVNQPPIRVGTAMLDHGRCLPWAMATPCIVCEEFCPTSPKAIWTETVEIPKRDDQPGPDGTPPRMLTVSVQRPHVDPGLCVGCGACERVCPIVDRPAIYVTSAGETRSKTNVILLENSTYSG